MIQCPLVEPRGVAQATLRRADVRQDERANHFQGDIAGLSQTGLPLSKGLVGFLQVSAGPVGEPQKRTGGAAPQGVTFGQEAQRLPGVVHGLGHVAGGSGEVGTDDSHAPWQ